MKRFKNHMTAALAGAESPGTIGPEQDKMLPFR
jgi:hypothetical protein